MANESVTTAAPDTNIELKNLKKYNAMRKMKRATAKLVAKQQQQQQHFPSPYTLVLGRMVFLYQGYRGLLPLG